MNTNKGVSMTKRQIWDIIYTAITLKQYNAITKNAGLKYDNYFRNTLKISKSKKLRDWAMQGLAAPLTKEDNKGVNMRPLEILVHTIQVWLVVIAIAVVIGIVAHEVMASSFVSQALILDVIRH